VEANDLLTLGLGLTASWRVVDQSLVTMIYLIGAPITQLLEA